MLWRCGQVGRRVMDLGVALGCRSMQVADTVKKAADQKLSANLVGHTELPAFVLSIQKPRYVVWRHSTVMDRSIDRVY